MSDRAKPWLCGWALQRGTLLRHSGEYLANFGAGGDASARLAAAAPALARALCRVEWPEGYCGECERERYYGGHTPDCPLDAALTAAGLATEDREEVRREGNA